MFYCSNWKKEVEILKSVSHVSVIIDSWSIHIWCAVKKYIVQFIDFLEKQKPILMMKYLPLKNLVCQNFITEEENLKVLYQKLHTLKYLHSHSLSLVHWDIKSTNILIEFWTPFIIKLVNFELTKNDFTLKTFCETDKYTASEIWECLYYTAVIDIWSLEVIVLQYRYSLSQSSQKLKGMLWCQDIVQKAEKTEEKENTLIDLISTKMLRMNYQYRCKRMSYIVVL